MIKTQAGGRREMRTFSRIASKRRKRSKTRKQISGNDLWQGRRSLGEMGEEKSFSEEQRNLPKTCHCFHQISTFTEESRLIS